MRATTKPGAKILSIQVRKPFAPGFTPPNQVRKPFAPGFTWLRTWFRGARTWFRTWFASVAPGFAPGFAPGLSVEPGFHRIRTWIGLSNPGAKPLKDKA